MIQKRFGSADSTGKKLDVIERYLAVYQKALSNKFDTLYVDGFAGSGEIPLGEHDSELFDLEVERVLTGSAERAWRVMPPFTRYIFIDKRKRCIDALEARFANEPNATRADYRIGDANEHIQSICNKEVWRRQRGVVLLDPFGSQVAWPTIEAIAKTRALDLWYLFPAGVSIFRQIARDGTIDPTHIDAITRIVGTEDWREAFLQPSSQPDLFHTEPTNEKVVTPESAAQYMIQRLKSVFEGGVLDVMIPLGRHTYPSYYLLFAWGNPDEKARVLASKLARAAVKATDRKYGRLI